MTIEKLNKMANSLHNSFNEFDKRARAEARAAIKARDQQRWEKIRDERRRAGKAMNDLLDLLEDQAMSTDAQKDIADALGGSTVEARDLVTKMKNAEKVLETVTGFANLLVDVLGTAAKIAAAV